jgi:hypothetical protein
MAEVLLEFAEAVSTEQGQQYVARACGGEMPDGLWEGWVEFIPLDGGEPLRSARETTQPNRQDTVYWATGLTPVYLEGSLRRTLNPPPPTRMGAPLPPPLFDGPAPLGERPSSTGNSIVNPFFMYQKGEAYLRRRLSALSGWHLVNVIRAHRLSDEDEALLNARHPASLVELIVERVRRTGT